MKEQKFHLYLSESERRFLIQNLIWFQNTLRREGHYTDTVIRYNKLRKLKEAKK